MKWIVVFNLILISLCNFVVSSPVPIVEPPTVAASVDSTNATTTSTATVAAVRMLQITNDMVIDQSGQVNQNNHEIDANAGHAALVPATTPFDIYAPEEDFESFQPDSRSIDADEVISKLRNFTL